MKTIEETQAEIVEEFNSVDDWMDRYTMIIEEGNNLPQLPEKYRTPSNLIEGCQSRVWINAEQTPEGRIHFEADSDAMIVKGIIALLVKVLDNRTPDEVLNADLHFINDIGLGENLSPTRSNGLLAMIKQLRLYAMAYKAKAES
ncbi:MAG: SufE family protein [Duncaniella sp.]|nr:SufE family protein [Duncaniella sp.]